MKIPHTVTTIVLLLSIGQVQAFCQASDPLPAIFDDFEYSSAEFNFEIHQQNPGAFEGSVFGRNDWLTTDGGVSTRAWRRFNWDDLALTCTECGFMLLRDGRLRIFIEEGGMSGGQMHGRIPTIKSGFVTGRGTYAARVRMHEPPPRGNFIQAFWTSGTDVVTIDQGDVWLAYMSETDIESYSRTYTGNDRTDLGLANYRGKLVRREGDELHTVGVVANHDNRVRNGTLQCVEEVGGRWSRRVECRDVFFDRDWIMSIGIEPRQHVDYGFRSADGRYAAGRVTGSANSFSVQPVRVSAHPPIWDVIAVFGLYTDGEERRLVADLILDVDWYYHTREIITLDEVLEQVSYWQTVHPRVNTLDQPFQAVTSQSDFEVSIAGPEMLPQDRVGSWRLALTPLNTTYIVERFGYSYLDCSDDDAEVVGEFIPVREPELVAQIPSEYDGMVIEATVLNRWSGDVRSASLSVSRSSECDTLTDQ